MFCYQCEQTMKGTGCTVKGVCGKDSETASLQDIAIFEAKAIAKYLNRAGSMGIRNRELDSFVIKLLFTCVTNVNFDPENLRCILDEAKTMKKNAKEIYEKACRENNKDPEQFYYWENDYEIDTKEKSYEVAKYLGVEHRIDKIGEVITGLEELLMYGLKGSSAYAYHALVLGFEDDKIYAFFMEALDFLTDEHNSDELLGMILKEGEINIEVMELLDRANTETYGHPQPTQVRVTPKKGKAIIVSGHDLKDMEEILKQTEGKGINVYSHGEMLPLHGYPELKKYSHFVGNFGGSWQDQQKEFDNVQASIIMTTNCIQKPKDSYIDRIFTSGLVAFPGVSHIVNEDFTPAIEKAMELDGFEEVDEEKFITVGFGRNSVLSVADVVIDAVKNGSIRHFFLIGGCDGAKPGRNYYTEFAEKVPEDCVILTLACGKYRFNKMEYGNIGGIPRLLDVGQCNDAYSAIQIAIALSNAFETDVNGLPLSFILSWYEQKAVCILLSLLFLGIQNIRLGPTLPAFIKPEVLEILQDKFNIMITGNAEEDLRSALAGDVKENLEA